MNQPIIKQIKPINFLFHRAEVKISDLTNQIPIAKELFKESVRLDLHPSGPIHWHYFGFMGDGSKSFVLEVCLPVASIPADDGGKFHFKRTENFKCVSLLHEGGWQEIPKSYGILMEYLKQQQVQATGVTRELYLNADFAHPEANITEIQMEIFRMEILVFSTSVKSMEEVNLLKPLIDSLVGKNNWNFALDDREHVLRIVNNNISANHAMALLHSKGYQCHPLE